MTLIDQGCPRQHLTGPDRGRVLIWTSLVQVWPAFGSSLGQVEFKFVPSLVQICAKFGPSLTHVNCVAGIFTALTLTSVAPKGSNGNSKWSVACNTCASGRYTGP